VAEGWDKRRNPGTGRGRFTLPGPKAWRFRYKAVASWFGGSRGRFAPDIEYIL